MNGYSINQIITDLLNSPTWVLASFILVYNLLLIFVVWKIRGWYKGLEEWNKHRLSEKEWKDKVKRLEKENTELLKKIQNSSAITKNDD